MATSSRQCRATSSQSGLILNLEGMLVSKIPRLLVMNRFCLSCPSHLAIRIYLPHTPYPLPAVVAGGFHHLASEGLGHAALNKGPEVDNLEKSCVLNIQFTFCSCLEPGLMCFMQASLHWLGTEMMPRQVDKNMGGGSQCVQNITELCNLNLSLW